MTFPASIFRVTSDRDGEVKLTFVIPSEYLEKALPLAALSGKLLSVSVDVDPSNG